MSIAIDDRTEWLETDGLGGFASGTTSGIRTRRYHGLLLCATTPPTGRYMLVNGLDVCVRTSEGEFPLSFHRYAQGVTNLTDRVGIDGFSTDPWPRWTYRLGEGMRIDHEVFVTRDAPRVVLAWKASEPRPSLQLIVRPLMSGRDYHALHHENPAFRFDPGIAEGRVRWSPYPDVPATAAHHNGRYRHEPVWYRRFEYAEERDRGFESIEDLASPGTFEFDLDKGEATIVFEAVIAPAPGRAVEVARARDVERQRRTRIGAPLERAADAYIVGRGEGTTIIAGYPWFADWGRDTFIAIRGLCLATGRLDDARKVLLAWAGTDSRGVLPNRFPDRGDTPEYNSVDASLWFIVAAHEFLKEADAGGYALAEADRTKLLSAVRRILSGYAGGTHHGIHLDGDGLLAAGEPGVQLTWMDARVGERVVTPRIGKPVEVQALWLNALRIGSASDSAWQRIFENGLRSFRARFWNEAQGCLYDVIDDNHSRGAADPSLRPNQIFAVGGLPIGLLEVEHARRVVDRVESTLLTPRGLRSLAPGEPGYAARYEGGPEQRDAVYHQGIVWPWLLGPFVEAWVRVRGDTAEVRVDARARFLEPMLRHLDEAGIGHVSEIVDAEPPFTPRGCPFQAWSVGELLRLDRRVLLVGGASDRIVEAPPRRGRVRA